MMKNLLLAIVAVFCFTTVNAQVFERGGEISFPGNAELVKGPMKAQGTISFGYWTGGFSMLGTGYAETYDCAIYVPEQYAGKTVSAFAFYLYDASVLSDVKGWVSTSLPSNVSNADYVETIASPLSYSSGANYIYLDNPITIPSDGCYVGYSFTVTSVSGQAGQYPLLMSTDEDIDGGTYLRTSSSMTSWYNMYGYGYGNLCISVAITGEFADNGATVDDFEDIYAVKSTESTATATITNSGTNEITSIAYTITDVASGTVSDETTYTFSTALASQESATVSFPIVGEATSGITEKLFTITKVNGEANGETANVSDDADLYTFSRLVDRKVVEEEFTATGCGYCTRGIAGMEALEATRADKWIGLAIHGIGVNYYDPMYVSDFDEVLDMASGYPSATLNRTGIIDPYFGSSSSMLGIYDDVDALAEIPAVADVEVTALWADEAMTQINVTSNVSFVYNSTTAPYALGYVLVADGLTGSSSYWTQYNYYAGATGAESEPYIYAWTQKGQNVTGYAYNHVAIVGQSVYEGIAGSISAPLVEDAVQSHNTTFDISNGVQSSYTRDELIQDKSQLKVVALLINTESGEIMNAAETAISGGTNGISGVTSDADATEVARYTVDGTQVSAPVKGVNIVKMSNGKTVKVVVK